METETPSGAGRIITGVDMWFKQVPKRRISAQDYYNRFPETYNPDGGVQDIAPEIL
jgi:hypothetical protein